MPKLEKKVEISAPVKKVWEVLTDMERYPKWQIDKKELKELEPNKYFVKSTSGDYTYDITEFIENKRISVKTDHPEITGVSYILNKKGDITEISCWVEYKTITYEKMIMRSLKIKTRSFKEYVEYIEDGGDPDEYDIKKRLIKP